MLSFDESQEAVLNSCDILCKEKRGVDEVVGFVLAEDRVCEINVSSFRNSSMDGFAIRSELIQNSTKDNPVSLPVTGESFPGEPLASNLNTNGAIKIMTGAQAPDECDAVVKIEDVCYSQDTVQFTAPASVGQFIRQPGEDLKKGEPLFSAGHRLSPLDIGLLAGAGISELNLFRKPKILICVTGNELVEPGQPLGLGEIYNSNSRTVTALVRPHCQSVETSETLRDNLSSLTKALDSDQDVIVTSGGVSAGERDFVPDAAKRAGWEMVFHKAAIKPGKPIYYAKRGEQRLFGLPGNPLSSAVTCALFVLPALKKMSGRADYKLSLQNARLSTAQRRSSSRTLIWPGRIWNDNGVTYADLSRKTSSAVLSALRGSDGLIVQPVQSQSSEAIQVDKGQRHQTSESVSVITWRSLLT